MIFQRFSAQGFEPQQLTQLVYPVELGPRPSGSRSEPTFLPISYRATYPFIGSLTRHEHTGTFVHVYIYIRIHTHADTQTHPEFQI